MTTSIEIQSQKGAIEGIERVRRYAAGDRKYARLMYRGVLRDIRSLAKGERLLEMGAGPGFLAMMVAGEVPGSTITAVDLSADMITVAGEYIEKSGMTGRIRYIAGDVGDAAFMEGLGKFDLIYTTLSLHHWESPEMSIQNLWNAVADGGALYIYDFRRIGWLGRIPFVGTRLDFVRASYTPEEIKLTLKEVGVTDFTVAASALSPFMTVIARR